MRKPSQTPQIEPAFLQHPYKKCNTAKPLCDPGSVGLSLLLLLYRSSAVKIGQDETSHGRDGNLCGRSADWHSFVSEGCRGFLTLGTPQKTQYSCSCKYNSSVNENGLYFSPAL